MPEIILLILKLFITFFKIGLFTFGGGYAMIPLISEEVLSNSWVANYDMLIDFIAISQSTPGTFAINIATFVGFEQAGILGAIFTTLGVILPSFIVILIIAAVFKRFRSNKYVVGFLSGVRPVVPGIIFAVALVLILRGVFFIEDRNFGDFTFSWITIVIFAVSFIVSKLKKRMHPIVIVLISGILGLIFFGLL